MSLSKQQVLHIAKLARIILTEKEVSTFGKQLSSILDYVNLIQEVNTEGVEETAQVTGLKHVLRPDIIERCENVDALLATSGYPILDHQIKVKKVI